LDVALRTPSVLSFKSTVGVEPGFPTAWLNNSTSCLTERPLNKCIGDDTKAAARQSPNCIKRNPKKYGKKRFSMWRMELLHPAMWQVALG